ncbi:hypothetical protein MPNT_40169 [Candidatus Methylacidithermus pantelleriae]|uniref:Uncharacterized protein n=1 Tax=Candidatus Methylacidithermus pantelleriae TaxID=2744239 RepID=A0A8J2FTB2_9BACT|nr:hypothetical protein MPNT_40169 [Candidatus Methylacidithermus pantelleriae]
MELFQRSGYSWWLGGVVEWVVEVSFLGLCRRILRKPVVFYQG